MSKVDMLLISCLASLFLARLYCDLLLSCSQAALKSNVELVRHVFNSASWGEIVVHNPFCFCSPLLLLSSLSCLPCYPPRAENEGPSHTPRSTRTETTYYSVNG